MAQNVEIIKKPGVDGFIVRLTSEFEISRTQWEQRKADQDYRLMSPDVTHTLTDKEIAEIDQNN